MKRSATIASLDDCIDVKLGNHQSSYDESVLVSSMMLVTIEEESRRGDQRLRKQRSDGSMGSMSAASSFSRSSSRGSLRGWGSSTSRKSYKVDLCCLAANDFHGDSVSSHFATSKNRRHRPTSITLNKTEASKKNSNSSVTNHAADSWGFFLG